MANSVDIANLQIRIKDNSEDAAEKVLSLAQALEELKGKSSDTGGLKNVSDGIATLKNADMSGLSRLRKNLANALAPARALAESMERIVDASKGMNRSVVNSVMKASKTTEGLQERVSGTTSATASERTTGGGASNATQQTMELSKKLQNQLDMAKFQEALPSMITDAQKKFSTAVKPNRLKQLGTVMKGVTGTFREFFHVAPNAISRTMSQLGRFMRMRMLRTIVKGVLMGITEGLQNVYQWAKVVGDGFVSTMDGMASSVLYLKNSVGAAFAQILSLVAPHINNLIDLIVEGINYVNMFFAVLAGQDTYTRAKKNAVEFAQAASGAIGGASAAAKELKEQLTVLDFDELHQLQAQQDPSSGGGGGGGGGASGTNYADMFEKAKIEQNWLTRTASWLKDNFNDILDVVKAIGAGILAWKLSTAFSNAMDGLWTLKQRLGITLSVAGFTLETLGAYDMGKNGANLSNIIKTAVGTMAGILGGVLAGGATSLMITIPLSIVLFIAGFSVGAGEAFDKDFYTNPTFRRVKDRIDEAYKELEEIRSIKVRVEEIQFEYSGKLDNINVAENLVDKLSQFNGLSNPSTTDLTEIQNLVGAINSMNLDGLVASWEILNGKVQINVDEMKNALEALKELAKQSALFDLYVEQTKAEIALKQAQQNAYIDQQVYTPDQLQQARNIISTSGGYVSQQWQPGDEVGLMQKILNPEVAAAMQMLTDYQNMADADAQSIADAQAVLDDINQQIDILNGTVGNIDATASEISGEIKNKTFTIPYAPDVYEKATDKYNMRIGSSGYDLQKQFEDITGGANLNIFADPTKNALGYAGAVGSVNDAQVGLSASAEQATRETAQLAYGFRGLDKDAGLAVKGVSGIDNALLTIGKGVDITGIGNGIRTTFVGSVSPAGYESKKAIEKEFDKIGGGVQYPQIMNGINTGLLTAERSTDFASRGTYIGGEMTTGSKGGYLSSDIINSMYSGLDLAQRVTAFSTVGKGIGGDVESGSKAGYSSKKTINTYLDEMLQNQKDTLFSSVGKGIGIDVQKGATENLNAETLMKALYEGLAQATSDMAWSNIGKSIGADIKTGIAYSLQGSTLQLTMAINGRNQSISGRVSSASMYALGGFPQVGELFWMNEANTPEMLGTIGGRTAVANREQIASAIAMALQPMLSSGGESTTTVNVNMDSASVARASFKGQRAMHRQYNVQAKV